MSSFNLKNFLADVFAPEKGEIAGLLADRPHPGAVDTVKWGERRRLMVPEWNAVLSQLGKERGFEVQPVLYFPATGAHNADLPEDIFQALQRYTFVLALTEFSATAPLFAIAKEKADFRAASMPGVEKSMEEGGLAADYKEIGRRCQILEKLLTGKDYCAVLFSTGRQINFDLRPNRLRSNKVLADTGYLHRDAKVRLANLPAGEVCQVPNEDEDSETAGEIPIWKDGGVVVLTVQKNKVVKVDGPPVLAGEMEKFFAVDPMRRNLAECAFGCNPQARVTGAILEDEKAGFHLAFGRSKHIGGLVDAKDFQNPANVIHQDIVYARPCSIYAQAVSLFDAKDEEYDVIEDGEYVIFDKSRGDFYW